MQLSRRRALKSLWRVEALALMWSGLCLWLASLSHAPSQVLLPVDPSDYMMFQAAVLPILLPVVALAMSGPVALLFGAEERFHAVPKVSKAMTAAFGMCLVWADGLIIVVHGHQSLSSFAVVSLPITGLVYVWLLTTELPKTIGLGTRLVTSLGSLLVFVLVAGPVLR